MATDGTLAGIRGVVFDMDGTLTVSTLDFARIRRECRVPDGRPILEYLDEADEAERDRVSRILNEHEMRGARECTLRPRAGEVLDELASRGMKLALVTRNSADCVEIVLERFGLQFEIWLSREHTEPKPAPDAVLNVAEHFGLPPEQLLVVGDYIFDVEAGLAAGARTAFIRTPEQNLEPPPGTHVVIDGLEELLELLPTDTEVRP
jgi:HAD superfamily hydrolase (TIGR01509 family)